MNPTIAAFSLALLAGALLSIPLLPAIIEVRLKRDAQPLNVIQRHAGDIRHFSYGFRRYIGPLQEQLRECIASGETATGTLPDGDPYILLGRNEDAPFLSTTTKGTTCEMVVLAGTDETLPDKVTFSKEIYAAGNLEGGARCSYRAILGDRDIRLRPSSKVMRWAHASGEIEAEHDCDLYGRISSERAIRLEVGCVFQRLNAPAIVLGQSRSLNERAHFESENKPQQDAPLARVHRRLYEKDLRIEAGEIVDGDIVVRGELHIGSGARVFGSVKGNKDVVLESDVSVSGSLISSENMRIGPGCFVNGPIVAERRISIEHGTRCGSLKFPTTVSATTILAEEGVLVFGTVWARERGRVTPRN